MMTYFSYLPHSHHLILLVSLISIFGQYYPATPYAIVSSLLLLPFFRSIILLFSAPCFQTLWVYVCPLRWWTKFHTCTKQGVKLLFCVFSSLIFIEIYLTSWQYLSPVTSIVGWQTGQELKRTWNEADMVRSSYFPIISLKRMFSVMVVACLICHLWTL